MPSDPFVSIVIPHYQTPELARLCLRAIRFFTRDVPYEVIVVDNGSNDDRSLEYLRRVEWIRLIERGPEAGTGPRAHKQAVDVGFRAARAPFVLAAHTDTVPVREDWLSWLVEQILSGPLVAAVGTYKLELPSVWERWLKRAERAVRQALRLEPRAGVPRPYIRSHCALYRRDVLERLQLRYDDNDANTAGQNVHLELERHGYVAKLLPVEEMLRRVVHLNHATLVLRPELGANRRTVQRGQRRIRKFLSRPEIRALLADKSLDRGPSEAAGRAA